MSTEIPPGRQPQAMAPPAVRCWRVMSSPQGAPLARLHATIAPDLPSGVSAGGEKPSFPPIITGTPPVAHPGAGVPAAVYRGPYSSRLPCRISLYAISIQTPPDETMAGQV